MHKSSVPMTKVPNNHVSLITQKHLNEYDLISHKNKQYKKVKVTIKGHMFAMSLTGCVSFITNKKCYSM